MAEYNFKNLSETEVISETPSDGNVLGLVDNTIVQIPISMIGGTDGGAEPFIINVTDTEANGALKVKLGDAVLAAINAGRQIYIYQSYIQIYAPVIAIKSGTVTSLTGTDTYPAIVLTPMIYQNYAGSGTYTAAFQTSDSYENGTGDVKIRVTSFNIPSRLGYDIMGIQ